MSSTTKKVIIDPKSTEEVKNQLTTADEYRQLDAYLRVAKQDQKRQQRRMARNIEDDGEQMLMEIEQKNREREEKRIQMIEFIHDKSGEKFVTLKNAQAMPFEDLVKIYNNVVEWKKPMWRKIINVFR